MEAVKLGFGGYYWYLATLGAVAGTQRTVALVAAWLSLICAVVVFVGAFRLTSAATDADREHPAWPVVSGIATNSIGALCFTFIAFLHIAYFMTFALAFHDKATSGRSLYRTAAFVTPESFGDADQSASKPDDLNSQSTCDSPHRYRVRRFFFALGKSDLESMKELEAIATVKTLRGRMCGGEQLSREAYVASISAVKTLKRPAKDLLYVKTAAWNLREKYELRKVLEKLKDERRRTCTFEVVGHANAEQPEQLGNGTNVDKSSARVESTKRMIRQLASEAGITEPLFNTSPMGNESSAFLLRLDKGKTHWDDIELDPKLSVEVQLRPITSLNGGNEAPRNPTLLDYTYFMIYTITTTGYGDLVPSAPFTRFLASIANLFELLFVVIIFNVVLALRTSPKGGEPVAAAAAVTADVDGHALSPPEGGAEPISNIEKDQGEDGE